MTEDELKEAQMKAIMQMVNNCDDPAMREMLLKEALKLVLGK